MAKITSFFLILTVVSLAIQAHALTCEEYRASLLSVFVDVCSGPKCTEIPGSRICQTYSPINITKLSLNNGWMTKVQCIETTTADYWDTINNPPNPPTQVVTVDPKEFVVSDCHFFDAYPRPPSSAAGNGGSDGGPPRGCSIDGSLVWAEEQVLSEEIPVAGGIALVYSSRYQNGYTYDRKIRYQVVGAVPRDYLTGFEVQLIRDGSVVNSSMFSNATPNQEYTYSWNGQNSSNTGPSLSASFVLNVREISPSGTFDGKVEVVLSHFDGRELGLGGWLPAVLKRYDFLAKKMYAANGSYELVEAKPLGVGQFYVANSIADEIYVFDAQGVHRKTKSGLLGVDKYVFDYDGQGRISSITEPFGRVSAYSRNAAGDLASITSPNGQSTFVEVDINGYLVSVQNPRNEKYLIDYYGSGGLLQKFEKPNGEYSLIEYDSDGLLVRDAHSGGYFFEIGRIAGSGYTHDISISTALGRIGTIQTSVSSGYVERNAVSSSNGTSAVVFTSSGSGADLSKTSGGMTHAVLSVNDQRFGPQVKTPQAETYTFYGGGSRSISRTQDIVLSNPSDPFSISSWQTVTQLSGENTTTTLNYDPVNKKFTSSTYLGKTSEWTIDNYERMVSSQQGTLEPVIMGYTNEHLTSVNQGSRTTSFAYSPLGLMQSVTNPLSQTTSYIYDSANRVASKILPDSRVVGFAYDGVGNITGITPPGRPVHSFVLNGHGLVGAYEPPTLSGVSVVNTTYTYNLDKQLTSVVRPDGGFINYNFNATTGVLENYETSEGFYYQSMDTVVGLPNHIETPAGVGTQVGYMGRSPASYSNTVSGTSAGGYTPTFGTANRLESDTVTGPTGTTSTISYLYNDDEDLRKAGDVNLTYNVPNGQLTGTSMGSGASAFTDTYAYNTYGEVTGYQAKRGTTVIYDLVLSRDGMGRIDGKTQTMNAVTDDYDYTFDSSGRLTQVQKNSVVAANYSYDSNSNRTGGNVGAQPTTATYDDQDRLLTYNSYSFTYNANGDLQSKTNSVTSTTTQYSYDVFGNLRQVVLPTGTVIAYEVDALNRRIGKRVNGTLQKRWIYMDQYRIVAETNAAGTITKRFIYGSKANIPDYMIASGIKYRIISDHLGSPRLVVKQSDGTVIQRMDHDEFGRVLADTNPGYLPFGFAGGLYDHQTSLVRFGVRDYDPELGRWTSKDPIRFEGDDTNLFGYVLNDPVNLVDIEGMKPSSGAVTANPTWPAGGGIAVGVATELCSPKSAEKKEDCQQTFNRVLDDCIAGGGESAKCISKAGKAYRACVERANAL